MAKYFTFRKVEVKVEHTSSYGRYKVTAHYRGKDITAYTNDSYSYDWCDDDTPNGISRREAHERMMAARNSLLSVIREKYNNQ